jgi:hypothetical protein
MRRVLVVVLGMTMAVAGGVARAQAGGDGSAPPSRSNEGERRPTLAPQPRTPPGSGTEGSVSDWAASREPGGNSTTRQAGGITETGGPSPQASGQSGNSVYPY